ncbi:hypothetical protein FE257_006789 [Aspergillus nanangensis]|uniref:Uncharacterized protein n=1 Tax=Aspergillus nanangensis TaxID=2582783 RepID=A0AAD4GUM7_ASPNN|nr:hypothetical protein FE257_006789 [Aspergillus nanangensis]
MAGFKGLLPPQNVSKQQPPQPAPFPRTSPPYTLFPTIRDQLTITSWLLLGGLLQGISLLLLGPLALLPTICILLYRTTDHLLMALHLTPNRYMNGVVPSKFSSQAPHPDGSFGTDPAAESIVVFHLGARSNHPLGILAPGYKAVGDRSARMNEALMADPVKYGLLGMSRWLKQEDGAGNDTMTVYYLRDYEALHRFAHEEIHMEAVRWWADIVKEHPHISIYHESYLVGRGQWENVFVNSKPTGVSDLWFPVRGKGEDEVERFVRPVVDARDGVLKSAARRLKLARLEEQGRVHEGVFDRPYL